MVRVRLRDKDWVIKKVGGRVGVRGRFGVSDR